MSKDAKKKVARTEAYRVEQSKIAAARLTKENEEFVQVSLAFKEPLGKVEGDAYAKAYFKVVDSGTDSVRACHEAGVEAVMKVREKAERDAAAKREKRAAEIAARSQVVVGGQDPAPTNDTLDDQGAPMAPEVTELLQAQA
jgi:hypothetical protein